MAQKYAECILECLLNDEIMKLIVVGTKMHYNHCSVANIYRDISK